MYDVKSFFTFLSLNVHIFSVKMPLSSKVNLFYSSSVTLVCVEEAFLMKLSPLSCFFLSDLRKKCTKLFDESSIVHTLIQFDCTYVSSVTLICLLSLT